MSNQSVTIEIPNDLYERIQRVATQSQRSFDELLVNSLYETFDPITDEIPLETLEAYSDDQLWSMIARTAAWLKRERLSEKDEDGELTESEESELDALIDETDNVILVRSQVVFLLSQRGYDVSSFFAPHI